MRSRRLPNIHIGPSVPYLSIGPSVPYLSIGYEEAIEKLIHDMFLLSGSMHLSLEVLLTSGADEEVSLTDMERIRILADSDYIKETKRFDL